MNHLKMYFNFFLFDYYFIKNNILNVLLKIVFELYNFEQILVLMKREKTNLKHYENIIILNFL